MDIISVRKGASTGRLASLSFFLDGSGLGQGLLMIHGSRSQVSREARGKRGDVPRELGYPGPRVGKMLGKFCLRGILEAWR